jgi:parvulin-like peptidyl-prolyl isomerase
MRILREPLLHFLVLGALVFGAARLFDSDSGRYRIDAGPAQRARIEATYRQQYGVSPTPAQLKYLLDQYVRSEILFREGLALGLDREDEIVRRRVVQKIEFLNEDTQAEETPSEVELEHFFAAHRNRYATPASVSFVQVYFSADRGGEAAARTRAEGVLTLLQEGSHDAAPAARSGDTFANGTDFEAVNATDAASLFGDSPFSAALFTASVGEWAGPFRSGYGWHLLHVASREASRPPSFEAVKNRVQADYVADARERRNEAEFRRLASKYQVLTEGSPT